MNEFDSGGTLSTAAEREQARLSRDGVTLDLRDELRFRVWPFLKDLADAVFAEEPDPAVSIELVARTVSLLIGFVNNLGQPVSGDEAERIQKVVSGLVDEWICCCNQDQLAAFINAAQQNQPTAETPTLDANTEAQRELVTPADTAESTT
jgi:hypothetical protein